MRISDWSSDVCSSDLKEDAEVVEDRRARRRDEGDVEQVGLANAQQQTRDRQHRDRQHQRAAERLERFENLPHYRVSSNARASERTSAADLHCSASSACARASTSFRPRTICFAPATTPGPARTSVLPPPPTISRAAAPTAT